MAGVQLDELEKAQRSMRVSIFNSTLRVMTRQKVIVHQGTFRVQPPETIDSLSTVEFGSESSGMMTGTEAGSIYVMQGIQGFFEFGWNNPYFGKRGYKKVAPNGFEVECSAIDGTNCAVSFVVTETAAQRTEAEIQQEKLKVDAALGDMERVVKGIEKMRTVYAASKDAKSMKHVEDELAVKQADMDQARARLHSLNLELAQRVNEEDPTYIQQELQKIKGKIEAAGRVKKGIEMMKDMYSSGSQKDPRQALIVDQQLESKKREMDALHKFEQKLLEKLNKLNSGAPTQTPVTDVVAAGGGDAAAGNVSAASGGGDSTAPVYAKILFEVVPNSDTELALQAGDIVTVVDKSGAEWWEGEFDGKRGYFPASYAELVQESTETTKQEYTYPKATVIAEYIANAEGELSLKVGEVITIYGWEDAYWWEGSKGGTVGFFPCQCVQWIDTNADTSGTTNTSGNYYEDIGKKDEQHAAPEQHAPAVAPVDHVHPVHVPHAPAEHAHHTPAEQAQHVPPPVPPHHTHTEPVHPVHVPAAPTVSEAAPLLATPQDQLPPPIQDLPPPPVEDMPPVVEPPQEPAVVAPVPRKLSHPPAPQISPEPQATLPPPISQPTPVSIPAVVPATTPAPISTSPTTTAPATTPTTTTTNKPLSASQAANALRRGGAAGSSSSTALSPAKPAAAGSSAKPRALPPQPASSSQTNLSPLSMVVTDTSFNSFRDGLHAKAMDFTTHLEQYTLTAVSQYLDVINKLQDKVKELETLNAQVTRERDELKATNAQLLGNTGARGSKATFWEEARGAVKK